MEPHRFDTIARSLAVAGSRRRLLTRFAGGAAGAALTRLGVRGAAASCFPFGSPCAGTSACCAGVGLRCRDGQCRCRPGWQRCQAGIGCQNLANDPDHCGACDHDCPPSTPCCVNGACRPKCGNACCADCFNKVDRDTGEPIPDTEVCCPPRSICGHLKPGPKDDRCCYPDEKCVNGKCCCHGCLGSVKCGGKCCAEDSCCNGECCPKGRVCAGNPPACVSGNRDCDNGQDCEAGEACVGGRCCSGNRICKDADGDPLCCNAGQYCENPNTPIARCCPVNRVCNDTYRAYRVRA